MRIVHVIDTLDIGGAEVIVATLCRLHRQQGHDPSVVCLFRRGSLGEQLRAEGFSVDCIGPASAPALAWRFLSYFRHRKPSVVHCHNAMPTIAAAWPAKLAGATVISTWHGLLNPPYLFRRELKFAAASRACAFTVGVCDATAANLRNAPLATSRVVRIYNGAPPAKRHSRARADKFTLVAIGRLVPAKDYETLLQAVALASSSVPNLELWVAGNGELLHSLRGLAENLRIETRVHFLGEVQPASGLLSVADVFVMSSITEGLPMALLEAMSAGLPCIVTDVGGMPEIVRLAHCGRIVSPRDPKHFATAIRDMAIDPTSRSRMGELAHAAYVAQFTPGQMAANYLKLYARGRKCEDENQHQHACT